MGLVGLDRQPEVPAYPSDFSYSSSNNNYNNNYNNNKEEEGGLANQILTFIGIKGTDQQWVETRVTRWLSYYFNIWPFGKMKICPKV